MSDRARASLLSYILDVRGREASERFDDEARQAYVDAKYCDALGRWSYKREKDAQTVNRHVPFLRCEETIDISGEDRPDDPD